MAMVLLLLIVHIALDGDWLRNAAVAALVVTMAVPAVFRPVAVVWLALSHAIGSIVSRVLLAIVFFGIVTPTGLVRRLLRKDSLRLRAFKASGESVLVARDHVFTARDLERPY